MILSRGNSGHMQSPWYPNQGLFSLRVLWYNKGMSRQNAIAERQTDLLKLEAIKAYFDFTDGRPTAKSVAEKLGISERTVVGWLADNANGELLDEIVPLWPGMAEARAVAAGYIPTALATIAGIMTNGRTDGVRLSAAKTLLELAGVREPKEGEEAKTEGEGKRPAVLLNLFLGGGQEPIQIVDGEAREIVVERPKQLGPGE